MISKLNKLEQPKKLFVGVDPSLTSTGVVALDNSGTILNTLTVKTKHDLLRCPDGLVKRLLHIEHEVGSFIEKLKKGGAGTEIEPEHVHIGYEHYSYQSVNKPFKLGELGGVLKTHFLRKRYNQEYISPSLLKKFATMDGQASKDRVKEQALKESSLPDNLPSDIYDAYFLAKFAWYHVAPSCVLKNECEKARLWVRDRLEITQKHSN